MGIQYDASTEAGMTTIREEIASRKSKGQRPMLKFIEDSKTARQRGYQWGWLYKQAVLAMSEGGISISLLDGGTYPYDVDILHEILKKTVAKPLLMEQGKLLDMKAKNGNDIPQKISTEDMEKPLFSEYVKRCKAFFFEYWGFVIPHPEDAYYSSIEKEVNDA
jgi:hypothetical protein